MIRTLEIQQTATRASLAPDECAHVVRVFHACEEAQESTSLAQYIIDAFRTRQEVRREGGRMNSIEWRLTRFARGIVYEQRICALSAENMSRRRNAHKQDTEREREEEEEKEMK